MPADMLRVNSRKAWHDPAARFCGVTNRRTERAYSTSRKPGHSRQLLMCVTQLVAKLWHAHSSIKNSYSKSGRMAEGRWPVAESMPAHTLSMRS
jgi:hypothetical protein